MERLDFSAVMGVLRKHVNEDLCPNQTELADMLFDSFISSPDAADFVFDPGQVCRWIKGQTRLSPQISSFYLKPANQKKLTKTIERDILPMMADSAMAVQELYDLLQQDQEISEQKKEELANLLSILIYFCQAIHPASSLISVNLRHIQTARSPLWA